MTDAELLAHYYCKFIRELKVFEDNVALPPGYKSPYQHFFRVDGKVVGVAIFFMHPPTHDTPDPFYFLDWVFIEGPYRNQGLLKSEWPNFRRLYGEFWVSTPRSEVMRGFLEKYGTERQRRINP